MLQQLVYRPIVYLHLSCFLLAQRCVPDLLEFGVFGLPLHRRGDVENRLVACFHPAPRLSTTPMFRTDDYDYELPDEAIAQTPIEPRHDARLLRVADLSDRTPRASLHSPPPLKRAPETLAIPHAPDRRPDRLPGALGGQRHRDL